VLIGSIVIVLGLITPVTAVMGPGAYSHPHSFVATPSSAGILAVVPANGTVGSVVSASGSGFPANATVAFQLGGVKAASTCKADGTGSFPGTTGTACTFAVPARPGGPNGVSASSGTTTAQATFIVNGSEVLAPSTGPVGSTVSVTGTGFPANSAVGLVLGSSNVSGSCWTDQTGSFPGTTGTSCNVTAPATPGGSQELAAVPLWQDSAGVAVGSDPIYEAYDPLTSELLVSNYQSRNISVISVSNDTVVRSLGAGDEPDGIAYDAGAAEIYVANSGSKNVSVINASSYATVTAVKVGSYPDTVTYDPAKGEIFVTDQGSSEVSVINDTTHKVVATVAVGSNPDDAAYDPATGEVFVVAFTYPGTVSVIADSNNTVVATITVAYYLTADCYDPAQGEIFVTESYSSVVAVISDSNDTVVASIPAGSGPYGAVYDPSAGEVLVPNSWSDNVTVIADSDNAVVSTLPSAGYGVGIVYDPGTQQLFIATGGSDNVTVFHYVANSSTNTSASFTIVPHLGLGRTSGAAGSVAFAAGTGFDASSAIAFWFNGTNVSSNCTSDTHGSFPGTTGTSCSLVVPLSAAFGANPVEATDGVLSANTTFFVPAPLNLTPSSGAVGTQVSVRGDGDGPAAALSLSINGTALPTTCASDATGRFPGTTGTPCTFLLPPTPGGRSNVTAYGAWNSSASIEVGSYPWGDAYDPSTGQVFVANYDSNSISVISDTTSTVVATVAVGYGPQGVVYDARTHQIFVANSGSEDVSVISDTTDAVVATVAVGYYPEYLTYDPGTSQLFVPCMYSENVTIISDTTDRSVGSVDLGYYFYPSGATYDSGTHQIFVTNYDYAGSVAVIDDSNDSVVATVGVGYVPAAAAYDPSTGDVFVADMYSDQVSVIEDVTDTVVATVATGAGPSAVTYDPAAGAVFVPNAWNNNLTVISETNFAVIATIAVGPYAEGAAYDSGIDAVFVPDGGSDNVTQLYQPVFGSGVFTVNSSVGFSTTTGTADVGQKVAVAGNGLGSDVNISAWMLAGSDLSCISASVGGCAGGLPSTDAAGAFIADITVPTVPVSGAYNLTVTDSAGHTAEAQVVIDTAPEAMVPQASSPALDLGASTVLSVQVSNGSGGYRFVWSGLPPGCSGAVASFTCTPNAAGNYSIKVVVTDSNGVSVASASLSLPVFKDASSATPLADLGTGAVDAGQSVSFSTSASFGSGTYLSYTWTGLPSGCTGTSSNVTCSGSALPPGNYAIAVAVTDSTGFTSTISSPLLFDVAFDPSVSGPLATRASSDVGQAVTFSGQATLGSGSYQYEWSGLPTGCTSVPDSESACTPSAPGTFDVELQVTDSNQYQTTSAPLAFTVYADPSVALTANRTTFDADQPLKLSANVTNGSGGSTFGWTGLPPGCDGSTGPQVQCAPRDPGRYTVGVRVTDSNGEAAVSTAVSLVIASPLSASIEPGFDTVSVGQSDTLQANATGGTGPWTYAWVFGDGSRAQGGEVNHSYAQPGSYVVTLWVNDSVGGSLETSTNLSVVPAAGAVGNASEVLWAIVIVALVAVAAAAALVVRRRRGPPSEAAPEEGEVYEETVGEYSVDPPEDPGSDLYDAAGDLPQVPEGPDGT
jgi:YVTN family beta-propeller protein